MHIETKLDVIFDAISRNPIVTRDEIEREFREKTKKQRERDRRSPREVGNDSEEWVKYVLHGIDFVREVQRTRRFSVPDIDGKDLLIFFEHRKVVYGQVKSGEVGISEFMSERNLTPEDLIKKKMIIFNGRDGREKIIGDFIGGVIAIDDYWSRKGRPVLSAKARESLGLY